MPKAQTGKGFQIDITDFSGGVNTLDNPRELQQNQAQVAHNFDIVGRGSLQKRYGYDVVSSGGANSIQGLRRFKKTDSPTGTFLIIFDGNQEVFKITPSNSTFTSIGSHTGTAGERVNSIVFNNLCIFNSADANSSVHKTDGSTETQLGGSPPNTSVFATNDRVLFLAGDPDNPSIFYWCDLDNPENWSSGVASNQDVAVGDGTVIKAITVHNDNFTIFKEKAKYGAFPVLDGTTDQPTGFVTKEVFDRSDGTQATNSVAYAYTGVYYLGSPEKGFQRYGIEGNFPDRRIPQNISYVISPDVKKIRRSAIDKSASLYFDNRYYCAVPFQSDINTMTFVYNDIFAAWTTWNIPASCFEVFEDADGKEEIYFGLEADNKLCKFNTKFYDQFDNDTAEGFPIIAIWRSKVYRPSSHNAFKSVLVRGAITDTEETEVEFKSIVRTKGNDGEKQIGRVKIHKETITKNDILLESEEVPTADVGDFYVGNQFLGSQEAEQDLKEFEKIIHVPVELNRGEEIEFELVSRKAGEGIRIDLISLFGETMTDQDLIY